MAVTKQEEMLLAALRMKRARIRETIIAEFEETAANEGSDAGGAKSPFAGHSRNREAEGGQGCLFLPDAHSREVGKSQLVTAPWAPVVARTASASPRFSLFLLPWRSVDLPQLELLDETGSRSSGGNEFNQGSIFPPALHFPVITLLDNVCV